MTPEHKLEYDRAYREANREKLRAYQCEWRSTHQAETCEAERAWRAAHPGKVKEYRQEWKRRNSERVREDNRTRMRAWRAAHPDVNRLKDEAQRDSRRDARNEESRAWRKAHPDQVRENNRIGGAKYRALAKGATVEPITKGDRSEILARNSGLCVYCNARSAVQLDHVIPLSRGGAHAVWNLAGACGPCNCSKNAKAPGEWRMVR